MARTDTNDKNIAVSIKNVSKYFSPTKGQGSIKQLFTSGLKKREIKNKGYWALKDVEFDVEEGDFFGIVGRNGSGKSTLLKMIAGIYSPTGGKIKVNGKLVPFIELGVGFNPELSGRDNVFLNGALLGFSRKEMIAMYDEIVSFAELEDHMEVKLRNYSSGMQVRLAFSIAIRTKSDILLIDEVLAVGDAVFQQKCFEYFKKIKAQKKTVIFVSHDMNAVQQYCTRAAYVKDSHLIKVGTPKQIARLYEEEMYETLELQYRHESSNVSHDNDASRTLKNEPIIGIKCNNSRPIKYGEDLIITIDWPKNLNNVRNVGAAIFSSKDEFIHGNNSIINKKNYKNKNTAKITYNLMINEGEYYVTVGLFGEKDTDVIFYKPRAVTFGVKRESVADSWQGLTNLKSKWE